MCFGIRISSSFDLNTLNIPIQNIKCPKNTRKNFLPSHYLWSLNCVVFAQACQTQSVWPAMLSMNHIVTQPSMLEGASKDAQSPSFLSFFRCNALCRDMWSKMKVITEFCYFFFKAWNVLPCVKGDGLQEVKITLFNTNSLVFLGHLIFWMGMFKGFRSNGLEILIPKHMWKSIIGPLEQI